MSRRLRDPQYIDRVADELSKTRAQLEETERNQRTLLMLAARDAEADALRRGRHRRRDHRGGVVRLLPERADPGEGARRRRDEGNGQPRRARAKRCARCSASRLVLALADNDAAGRRLIEDGHIKKGGVFKQLPNGIHWCLLKPTEGFAAAMKAHEIPAAYWPFTIEAAFPPVAPARGGGGRRVGVLRRRLRPSFFDNPDLAPPPRRRSCRSSAPTTTPTGI